jgi:hypothetical protein
MPARLNPGHGPARNPYVPKRERFAWESPTWDSLAWYQKLGVAFLFGLVVLHWFMILTAVIGD